MSGLPPSEYATAFRIHVGPRLESMIGVLGHLIGVGLYTFSEAHRDVVRYAGCKGAYLLPSDHLLALEDWIGAELMDVAAETEAAIGR